MDTRSHKKATGNYLDPQPGVRKGYRNMANSKVTLLQLKLCHFYISCQIRKNVTNYLFILILHVNRLESCSTPTKGNAQFSIQLRVGPVHFSFLMLSSYIMWLFFLLRINSLYCLVKLANYWHTITKQSITKYIALLTLTGT